MLSKLRALGYEIDTYLQDYRVLLKSKGRPAIYVQFDSQPHMNRYIHAKMDAPDPWTRAQDLNDYKVTI